MSAADAYIEHLIGEKRQAQQYAGVLFAIAAAMQQLADGTGNGFGVLPLTADLPLSALQQIAAQLAERIQPPTPAAPVNGHGKRVPVGTE